MILKNVIRFYLLFLALTTIFSFKIDAKSIAKKQSVLVFSFTKGFRHSSIADGVLAIQKLGKINKFDVDTTEDVKKFTIESDWMDASHTKWFNSMFDTFLGCIERKDILNAEIRESYACVEIIEKCYQSSAQKSQEIALQTSPEF